MNDSAGQPGWQRAIENYLARMTKPGLHLREMLFLWATAFTVVVLACLAFFIPLYWLFS